MNEDELKILAEWYYGKENRDLVVGEKTQAVFTRNKKTARLDEVLCLDSISSQLDMLEDKMIDEANFRKKIVMYYDTKTEVNYYSHWVDELHLYDLTGNGKDENEARLNAIISYIRSKK